LTVQVDYSRPYKKRREIFGKLLPYGQVWRTGANEATIFDVKQDIKIGDKSLKAGKYTLWTIPNADKWTVILNSETGQWGTNYNEKKDVCNNNNHCGWYNNKCYLKISEIQLIKIINKVSEELINNKLKSNEILNIDNYFIVLKQ
jgi:hypothetical protein